MILFYVLILLAFILLTVEYLYLRYCINNIALRILVNGTRGKSSVVKYISAALRESDKKTVAKVTGVIPTIIYPDGLHKVIKRIAPARVQEQLKIIRLASKLSSDCLVLECMSITPELQKLESKVFKPHIYVITNIKDDHREQIGNEQEQAKAICDTVPVDSIVITSETKYYSEIEKSTQSKKSSLIFVDDEISEIENIAEGSFESNIKIAITVCKAAGIDEGKARNAIINEIKNSEELINEYSFYETKIKFINGFAVNDVTSSQEFLNKWQSKLGEFKNLNIIFNSRSDRPLRSVEFAKWFGSIKNLNRIILIGSHTPRTRIELLRNGIESQRIITWTKRKIKNAISDLKEITEPDSVFVGLGNIAGEGLLFTDALKETQTRSNNDN